MILFDVIAFAAILSDVIAPALILAAVIAPALILSDVMAFDAIAFAVTSPDLILAAVIAPSTIKLLPIILHTDILRILSVPENVPEPAHCMQTEKLLTSESSCTTVETF